MTEKQPTTSVMFSFIQMLRSPNLLLIIGFFWMGEHFILSPLRERLTLSAHLSSFDHVLFVIDILLITLFGYWINDVHDRTADLVNRPKRAIPGGLLHVSTLHRLAWLVFGLGLFICIYLAMKYVQWEWVWLYPLVGFILWSYGRFGKPMGVIGNLLVSILIAVLPGMLLLPELEMLHTLKQEAPEVIHRLMQALAYYIPMIFLSNLARELVKDMEDEEGDRLQQGRSLSILIGQKNTVYILFFILSGIFTLQWRFSFMIGWDFWVLSLASVVSLGICLEAYLLFTAQDQSSYAAASAVLKGIMLIGVLELILFGRLL